MHGSDADAIHSSNGLNGVASAAQLDLGFAERRVSVIDGVEVDEIALPTSIVKRDGRIVFFDPMRIERALSRCFAALGREPYTPIPELALRVVNIMSARAGQPTVEIVQDAVELTLQAAGEFEAAKAYILYRAEHAKQRQERPVPDEVRERLRRGRPVLPDARSRSSSSSTSTRASTTTRAAAKRGSRPSIAPSASCTSWCRPTPASTSARTVRALAAHDPRNEEHAVHAPAGHGRRACPPRFDRHLQLQRPAGRQHRLVLRGAADLDGRLRRGLLGREPLRRELPARPAPARAATRCATSSSDSAQGWAAALKTGHGGLVRRPRRRVRLLGDSRSRRAAAHQGRSRLGPGAAAHHARVHPRPRAGPPGHPSCGRSTPTTSCAWSATRPSAAACVERR